MASPGLASRLWMTSGNCFATAVSAPGNEANPPNPTTTCGARRRMTPAAWTEGDRRIANGPNNSRRQPLPRTLPKSMPSKSTPCLGTSRASMPSRVPSQKTRWPRRASSSATASPGKMWPPVPPVVIITVIAPALIPWNPRNSRRFSKSTRSRIASATQLATMPAAAEGQQRQRQALRRQHAHVDADVDERLHADPQPDALRDQRGKGTLEQRGLAPDRIRAQQQPARTAPAPPARPTSPSSSAITASRKSVCASGR